MSGRGRMDERARDRIRWHCRRGMLELDLVLSAFVERHLDRLDESRLAAFNGLLARTDPELLDLVMGRAEGRGDGECDVLALMRMSPCDSTDALTPGPAPEGRGEIRGAIG